MSSVQMAKVMGNQANTHMNGLQKGNYTDVVRYISSQKAESSKILKHPITASDNVVQRSWFGKLGTLLGTGVFASLGSALSILMGVSASFRCRRKNNESQPNLETILNP